MKEQKIVIETYIGNFNERIKTLMEDGFEMVPTSFQIVASQHAVRGGGSYGSNNYTESVTYFAVIMEKNT